MYTKEHRSAMARNKNVFHKLTFAFTSVLQRLYGQVYRNYHRFRNAPPADKPRAFLKLINSIIWADIMSAIGMTCIDTLKDLIFRKPITTEIAVKKLAKYALALPYLGSMLSPLVVSIVDSMIKTGSPNFLGAFTSAEFGRSVDNILSSFLKDFVRTTFKDIPTAIEDFKARDLESSIRHSMRALDITQRAFTGLAIGNAKKYTYDLASEYINKPIDSYFTTFTSDYNYDPKMQKTFTFEGKKYRLKKSAYNDLKAKAMNRAEQKMYSKHYTLLLDKAETEDDKKEVLKSVWRESLNYIKKERNLRIEDITIPLGEEK